MTYQILRKIWIKIFSIIYKFQLIIFGVKIQGSPIFLGRIQIRGNPKKIKIGNKTVIQKNVCFNIISNKEESGYIEIGDKCLIGDNSIISSSKSIILERNVQIAANSYLVDHDHKTLFTTSSPKEILIEENVWIGCNATILKGVFINRDSVIGAGSVISKKIMNTSLVVGNPQKIIKENE